MTAGALNTSTSSNISFAAYPANQRSLQHKVISTIAISVLIILTLAGNALVLAAFYSYKRIRRAVTNWFIVSLAVADILVALLTEPFWMSVELTDWVNLPKGIDKLKLNTAWNFLDVTCAIASIVNLMFISIDRYFAVKSPLSHHTKMTPDTTKFIIPFIWIYSAMTASLSSFTTWYWNVLLNFIIGFLIPLIVVIFSYGGILIVISSKRRLSNRGGKRLAKEFKTAKSLGVVTGAFIVCWLPFFIASLLFTYSKEAREFIFKTPAIISSVKWLHYSNSCLNPIIYAFLNPTFKIAFRNLFRRLFRKNDRVDQTFSFSFTLGKPKSTLNQSAVSNKIANGGLPEKQGILFRCYRKSPNESSDSTTGSGSEPKDVVNSPMGTTYTHNTYFGEKPLLNSDECKAPSILHRDSSHTPLLSSQVSNTTNQDNLQPLESNPLLTDHEREQQQESFILDTGYLRVPERPDQEELVPSNVGSFESKCDMESKTTSLSSDLDISLTAQLDTTRNEYCFFVDGVAIPEVDIKSSDV